MQLAATFSDSQLVFYSTGCPERGWFGEGLHCRPCPVGALWYDELLALVPQLQYFADATVSYRHCSCDCWSLISVDSVGYHSPGGHRLFPMAGYWTPSEAAGFVVKCIPAQRCVGGKRSECSSGYHGYACARCSRDHYTRGHFFDITAHADGERRGRTPI